MSLRQGQWQQSLTLAGINQFVLYFNLRVLDRSSSTKMSNVFTAELL